MHILHLFALLFTSLASTIRPLLQHTNTPATEQFIEKAALFNLFEIQSGQMILQRAPSQAYRNFAHMIISDHQRISSELTRLTQQNGVAVPTSLDALNKDKLDRMQSMSGVQLETAFKVAQVQEYQQAINLFESYTQSDENDQLKQFAQQTLPILQQNLQGAQWLPSGDS